MSLTASDSPVSKPSVSGLMPHSKDRSCNLSIRGVSCSCIRAFIYHFFWGNPSKNSTKLIKVNNPATKDAPISPIEPIYSFEKVKLIENRQMEDSLKNFESSPDYVIELPLDQSQATDSKTKETFIKKINRRK